MLAVMFQVKGARDDTKKALFERYKATPGIVATYQLENSESPSDLITFTVWEDEAAREKYMASSLKAEIDKANEGQPQRTIYNVLNSKS